MCNVMILKCNQMTSCVGGRVGIIQQVWGSEICAS